MSIYDFKKHFRDRRLSGVECRGCKVEYGQYGLVAKDYASITEKQLEAVRLAVSKAIKGIGKVFVRIYTPFVQTKKPPETRMGSGKGAPDHKSFPLRPGRIILEITDISLEKAQEILRLGGSKLPCKWEIIQRRIF